MPSRDPRNPLTMSRLALSVRNRCPLPCRLSGGKPDSLCSPRAFPSLTDAVEKVTAKKPWIRIWKKRIQKNGFLNQDCVLAPDLESIFLESLLKILFRQHRSKCEKLAVSKTSPVLPQLPTCERTSRFRRSVPEDDKERAIGLLSSRCEGLNNGASTFDETLSRRA